ncbi:MAG TPA: helix-turn-helix domain-containing protein [Ktedonobacteraceae bacterium]|nr:helix-turn-helix domain-containing protein [Ktedonobacteraceae bacterium]
MPATPSSPTPDNTTQKTSPHRPPEVDKFVDDFLDTVCDTSRRYILELLAEPHEGDANALPERRSGEIARLIGLSPATTSEHLRQLTRAGLVTPRREGNVVYYRLRNHKLVRAFQDLLEALYSDYSTRS